MGLDSGPTSDRDHVSSAITTSALMYSIPLVIAPWIPESCAAVSQNMMDSLVFLSGCSQGGRANGSYTGMGTEDAFNGPGNLIASGS